MHISAKLVIDRFPNHTHVEKPGDSFTYKDIPDKVFICDHFYSEEKKMRFDDLEEAFLNTCQPINMRVFVKGEEKAFYWLWTKAIPKD